MILSLLGSILSASLSVFGLTHGSSRSPVAANENGHDTQKWEIVHINDTAESLGPEVLDNTDDVANELDFDMQEWELVDIDDIDELPKSGTSTNIDHVAKETDFDTEELDPEEWEQAFADELNDLPESDSPTDAAYILGGGKEFLKTPLAAADSAFVEVDELLGNRLSKVLARKSGKKRDIETANGTASSKASGASGNLSLQILNAMGRLLTLACQKHAETPTQNEENRDIAGRLPEDEEVGAFTGDGDCKIAEEAVKTRTWKHAETSTEINDDWDLVDGTHEVDELQKLEDGDWEVWDLVREVQKPTGSQLADATPKVLSC